MQEKSAELGAESVAASQPSHKMSSAARQSSAPTEKQGQFQYDTVVHAHNYENIRDIPTGGYLKSPIIQQLDPKDAIANMSKK